MKITEEQYKRALETVRQYADQIKEELEKTLPSTKLIDSGIELRTFNCILRYLQYYDINFENYTLYQLSRLSRRSLANFRGIGYIAICDIDYTLRKEGLTLQS